MTLLLLFAGGWLLGAGVAWAFVAGANRWPDPEPFRRLDDLAWLARCA